MDFKKIIFVCSVFLVSLCAGKLNATHVAGGNMTYRCLGNSQYEITLEFRRDCFNGADDAQFDDPALFAVYDGMNNELEINLPNGGVYMVPFSRDDTLNETISSICNVIGEDVCVQTTTYRDTIILPTRPGGYIIAYQRCCRNNTLNNIVDPLNTGATYWVRITERALEECNNSPVFDRWPNAFICVNDTLRFNDSATDIDGDSLVYFLCTPSAGATQSNPRPDPGAMEFLPPFPQVEFAPGFSESNMMGGSPISIDSENGLILAVPDQVGQYLIGVCVREFRNGELLSEIRRDFEYNVRVCGRDPIAIFEPDFETRCDGLTINFENQSTSNFLPVEELQYTWFFDFPNTNLISNEVSPTFTFPAPGSYEVAMAVTDGLCVDTAYTSIGVSVLGDPTADFISDSYDCDGETILALFENSTTSQSMLEHIWIVTHGSNIDTLFGEEVELNIGTDQLINIVYEIRTESGCNAIVNRDVPITTFPFRVDFIDKIICEGESAVIFDSNLPDLTVNIDPSDNVIANPDGSYVIDNFTGLQDYIVSVTDGFCSATDTVTIQAADDPTFPLPDIIQCGSDTVDLNAFGPDFYVYEWVGIGITNPNEVNPQVSLTSSSTYFVTVSTSQGSLCRFTDTLNVIVADIPDFEVFPSNDIIYCEGDTLLLTTNPGFPSVVWSNENGNLSLELDTLTLTSLNDSAQVFVTVTSDDGCTSQQEISINYFDNPVIEFTENTINTVCVGNDAFLEITTHDSIVWMNGNGLIIGTGPQVIVPNVQGPDLVSVTAFNEQGCQSTASILVDLHPDPTIDFTPVNDLIICPDMIIPVILNTQDSVTWYGPNGEVIEIGPEFLISDIISNVSYSVSVINQFGCELTQDFDITVDPSIVPDVDISILDSLNVCIDTDFSVSVATMDSVTWLDLDGNILQVGPDFNVPNVTDTLTFVISVVDDFNCELIDTFDLNTFSGIDLMIDIGTGEDFYCEGESIDLVSETNVTANVTWYNRDTIIGIGNNINDYFPVGDLQIIAIAEDGFGCMSTDTINIRESQTEGNIQGDGLICVDFTTELTFLPEVDTDQFSIDWQPSEFIIEDNGLSVIVKPDTTTVFTATYSNEDGCITIEDFEVEVTGFFFPIDAMADPVEILLGQSSDLFTDQGDDLDYQWEPEDSLDDPNSSMPIATPLETTTYSVTVTDDNGCMATDTVTVFVIQPNCDESDIFIPNTFSPNGDSFNDRFRIESNFIDQQELLIYNRWGEEVFASSNVGAEWDGTFKGNELPPDVFGYHVHIVCINGFEYTSKGNITLMK